MKTIQASEIIAALTAMADEHQRTVLMRFFKTAPGDYGEGDEFLGLKVPQTRSVVREARLQVPFNQISILLHSKWHEVRLAGFLLLVEEMKAATPNRRNHASDTPARRHEIAEFYLAHASCANNWDLVDLSCEFIIGPWLLHPDENGNLPDRGILDRISASTNLWEQRIALVSTLALIREGQLDDSFRIAATLLSHPHDLIHKATGWVLREAGKRDKDALLRFLDTNYDHLPRTALRYAIERFPEAERQLWLKRKNS